MTTPALFDCGCDPDAPICACLPLWAEQTTDYDRSEDDE
jgi:hypothetical protein